VLNGALRENGSNATDGGNDSATEMRRCATSRQPHLSLRIVQLPLNFELECHIVAVFHGRRQVLRCTIEGLLLIVCVGACVEGHPLLR